MRITRCLQHFLTANGRLGPERAPRQSYLMRRLAIVVTMCLVFLTALADGKPGLSIAPQSLTGALTELAEQTGLQLVYPSRLTAGINSTGADGEMPGDVLVELLAGTDLTFEYINANTITLKEKPIVQRVSNMQYQVATSSSSTSTSPTSTSPASPQPSLFKRITSLVAGAMLATSAIAAETEASETEEDKFMEEIVVTATYRETAEMDTPVSMGTMSEEMLEETGSLDLSDIQQHIPGLRFSGAGESMGAINIRGIGGVGKGGPGRGESYAVTSVYYDDAPASSVSTPERMSSGTAFDIQRVEVLMGPQGALGGAGNIAGSVRFITNKPEMNVWRAKVQAGYQSVNSGSQGYRLDAMLNIPVIDDTLALRVLAFDTQTPGFIDRPSTNEFDRNETDIQGGRISAKWLPMENLEIRGSISRNESFRNGSTFADSGVPYVQRPEEVFAPEPTDAQTPVGSFDETDLYTLTVEVELPFADFLSSTAVSRRGGNSIDNLAVWNLVNRDGQFTAEINYGATRDPCWLIGGGVRQGAGCPDEVKAAAPLSQADQHFDGIAFGRFLDFDADVQEFRLTSNDDDARLRWVAGLYYKDEGGWFENEMQFSLAPEYESLRDLYLSSSNAINGSGSLQGSEETAVYATVDYSLTDTLEVNVGGRFTDLTTISNWANAAVQQGCIGRLGNGFCSANDNSPIPGAGTAAFQESIENFAPRVGLTWRPQDGMMFYTVYSTGFRPGGTNAAFIVANAGFVQDIQAQDTNDPTTFNCATDFIPNAVARGLSECVPESDGVTYDEILQTYSDNAIYEGDTMENLEIGAKLSLLDGRMDLIFTAYQMDWEDMIVFVCFPPRIQIIRPPCPDGRYKKNVGQGHSDGGTLSLSYAVTDNLFVRVGGAIIDASVDAGSPAFGQDNQSAPIPFSPEWTWTASVAYDFPVGQFEGSARLDWSGSDSSHATSRAVTTNLNDKHHVGNVRFTLRDPADKWRVALFGKNVTNEEVVTQRSNANGGIWMTPRTLGLELIYEFM